MCLQPHFVMPCVWWNIHSSIVLTQLWSVGKYVTFSRFLCINIVFLSLLFALLMKLLAYCKLMQCRVLMHRSLPHNPYCCLLPSHMCMLRLVICTLQLFTHCSCIISSWLHPVSVCDVAIAFCIHIVINPLTTARANILTPPFWL